MYSLSESKSGLTEGLNPFLPKKCVLDLGIAVVKVLCLISHRLTRDSSDSPAQKSFDVVCDACDVDEDDCRHSLALLCDPPPQVVEHCDHSVHGE